MTGAGISTYSSENISSCKVAVEGKYEMLAASLNAAISVAPTGPGPFGGLFPGFRLSASTDSLHPGLFSMGPYGAGITRGA